ncbi:Ribosome maturation factor RimP [compost metagenome]
MAKIAEEVAGMAQPLAQDLGLAVWDVEYVKEGGQMILRVYIDREDRAITHEDCEAMSRRLDEELDKRDLIAGAYYLEVSSPGAERPLRSAQDFERFRGQQVLIKTFVPVSGKKEWKGELLGATDGEIRIQGPKGEMTISRDQVSLIRLTIDL